MIDEWIPTKATQTIFLYRLQRVIRLRLLYRDDLNAFGRRMLERAIDATYRDCIEAGCADAARPIMAAWRRETLR